MAMMAYTHEINLLSKDVETQIKKLESMRETFYADGKGGQLYNTLTELKKRNFKIEDDTLNLIMQYPDIDSVDREIKELKSYLTVLHSKSFSANN